MWRGSIAALFLVGCTCGSPERTALDRAASLPRASDPIAVAEVPLPPAIAPDPDVPAGAAGPVPAIATPWSPDEDPTHPRHVIAGAHRLEIDDDDTMRVAETSFDRAIVSATNVERGWIFVAEDGAAAFSDSFLGMLRTLPDVPAPRRPRHDDAAPCPRESGARVGATIVADDGVYVARDERGFSRLDAITQPACDAVFDTPDHGLVVLRDGTVRATDDGGLTVRDARDDERATLLARATDGPAPISEATRALRQRAFVALAHVRAEVQFGLSLGVVFADGNVPLVIGETVVTMTPEGTVAHELAAPDGPRRWAPWGSALAMLTPPYPPGPQTVLVTRDGVTFTTVGTFQDLFLDPSGGIGLVRRVLTTGTGPIEVTTDAGLTFRTLGEADCVPVGLRLTRALLVCPSDPFHSVPRVVDVSSDATHTLSTLQIARGYPDYVRFDSRGHVCARTVCAADDDHPVDGDFPLRLPILSRPDRGVLQRTPVEEAPELPPALWIDDHEVPIDSVDSLMPRNTELYVSACNRSACILGTDAFVTWDEARAGVVHHRAHGEADRTITCSSDTWAEDPGDVVAATPAGPIVRTGDAIHWERESADVPIADVGETTPAIFVHRRRDDAIDVLLVEAGALRAHVRVLRVDAASATPITDGDAPFASPILAVVAGDEMSLVQQSDGGAITVALDGLEGARRLPPLTRGGVLRLPACTGEPSPLAFLATVPTGCDGLSQIEAPIARIELATDGYCLREIQARGLHGAIVLEPTAEGLEGERHGRAGGREVTCSASSECLEAWL